ncbi:MAG: DUF1819 family protein [Butyrivibrio sp.]|nr:DUF1819 family protein [Butyrivibrio sp.]
MSEYKYDSPYSGSGSLTREQFLFHETRIVAKLFVDEGLNDNEIVERIMEENLFQFPTEKSVKRIVNGCLRRLKCLGDDSLVKTIAHSSMENAKQACLYAMMKQYRLVWEYMITVIGAKYKEQDFSYGRIDLNVFFIRIQEQDEEVASWSDSTIDKIKQVLNKILVENEYIDSPRATTLNPVMICTEVENAIRANGDEAVLSAFNCFY